MFWKSEIVAIVQAQLERKQDKNRGNSLYFGPDNENTAVNVNGVWNARGENNGP